MKELQRLQAKLWEAETKSEREHYRGQVEWLRSKIERDVEVTRAIEIDLGLAYASATVLW